MSGGIAALLAAAAAVLALGASSAAAQETGREDVQAALDAIVAAGAPGAAATWTDGSGEAQTYSTGVGNLESGAPIDPADHYRIASQTKTWTATIILMLARQGKLSLNDTVEDWVPGAVPHGDEITVRQVLAMTSGYYEYLAVNGPMVLSVQQYPKLRWEPGQLAAIGASAPLVFPPGTGFLYSNTNYALLTMIAEAASGRSLGQLLRSKIIQPLGLEETSYRPRVTRIKPPFISGYTIEQGEDPVDATRTSPTIAYGAGAIVSTQGDVRRFFEALINDELLPAKWMDRMMRPSPQSLADEPGYGYGYGLEQSTNPCGVDYGHSGGFPGYLSHTDVTADGTGSFTMITNASPKIGSTAPFPPEIMAAYNAAKATLRCAIAGG
jgi:D-alanyl-D-alanine carboxypeptidase